MPSELLHGLAPIIGNGAKSLILGNMPSVLSLGAQQYYANPRNAFWTITGEIFGFDASAPYEERVSALVTRRMAVWDGLRSCRRVGSLIPQSNQIVWWPTILASYSNGIRISQGCSSTAPRPRRTSVVWCASRRHSIPAAAVDKSRADHAVRRQAGSLAGSHHRTSITVPWAFSTPILSSAGHQGLQMTAEVACRMRGRAAGRRAVLRCLRCADRIDTAFGRVQASD